MKEVSRLPEYGFWRAVCRLLKWNERGRMNTTTEGGMFQSVEVNFMAVLKLRQDNERAEIEFELDYLTSLTTQQRFDLMLRKSREMASLRKRHGSRRTTQIIKRT